VAGEARHEARDQPLTDSVELGAEAVANERPFRTVDHQTVVRIFCFRMLLSLLLRICGASAARELNAELSLARDKTMPVDSLGRMTVCLACGFAHYLVPEEALSQGRPGARRTSGSDVHA
jgi:hypothetical protein